MADLFDGLNEAQSEAVRTTEGYVRVIAGAGSGKTSALTRRYAYLVQECGIAPENILCLTFTNKAAKEMRDRVKKLLGLSFDASFVATIHSFCVRVLREDISKLFYPENFIVLDNADQKKILEEVYEEKGIRMDTATFQFMIDQIKFYKNRLTYLDVLLAPEGDITKIEGANLTEEIILSYIQKQKKYFGLDFFDLINFVIYLFQHHDDARSKWQKRMHYVMVDEFQDITKKEFKLIRTLTAEHKNWFVVGDPDQNIYEWRGSRMEILMDFDKEMKPAQTIMMNQNYRSTAEILAASNSLIEKNQNRIKKELYTEKRESETPVIHFHGKNEEEEMHYITEEIRACHEAGTAYYQMAVLYRSSHVSRFVEQGLLKADIPYTVYGGVGFYERMEIKDLLSYLRLIAYGDDLSFQRVANVPRRKMGKKKLDFLKQRAEEENCLLYDCLKNHIDNPVFSGSGARRLVELIEQAREQKETMQVSELLQRLLTDTEYELYIRQSGDMERLDNISELLRSIVCQEQDYGERMPLEEFLQEVSLMNGIEEKENTEKVKIMTMHTAKGLEFDAVFLAGFNERTFPSVRSLEERKQDALEEERRLCYVGMTRARKRLYLTESEGYGFRGYRKAPSRFLFDIDSEKIQRIGDIPPILMEEMKQQILETQSRKIFSVGTQVRHKVFGEGMIEAVDREKKVYTIRFLNGIKPIQFLYEGLVEI